MIIPIFLPHVGCLDRCSYCNQDVITDVGEETLRKRIEQSLGACRGLCEVGLFGGNMFGIEPEALYRLFSYFNEYRDKITNFRISTKPVPLNDDIVAILKSNNVTVIELGIPTFNNHILKNLNRKHTGEDLGKAFHRLTQEGFHVALQVMVGLPYETRDDIKETVSNVIRLNPSYIRIYPLAFIEGTPLAEQYISGEFTPITFEEALYRAMFIYLKVSQRGIKIVKMGLTDNEVIKDRIIAGYHHPAFGHLVKSEAFFRAIMAKLEGVKRGEAVTVFLNARDISHLLGHERKNLGRFEQAGLAVSWQADDIPAGAFALRLRDGYSAGSVFDALSGS